MRYVTICSIVAAVLATSAPAYAYDWPGDAPYSVARAKMDDALACRDGKRRLDGDGRKDPVLLVHGTGVTRRQNWGWNYWDVLHARGFEVCWVQLPRTAVGDAQISAEYVARAVQVMHRRTDERVDVLGHSQGGLVPRWSIKWFPSARHVADYIGLASPNHGTVAADAATAGGSCFASCWQMRTSAKFIAALNAATETPGPIHYTSIYSQFDQLVQPPATAALAGGRNILLQDICPGRPVDHVGIVGDYVSFRLVMDALTHPGAARPGRLPDDVCGRATMPGAQPEPDEMDNMGDWTQGRARDSEPPLKPYARDY